MRTAARGRGSRSSVGSCVNQIDTRRSPSEHAGALELRNNRRDACARRFLVLLAILAAGCGRERPSDAAPTTTQSEEEAIGGFEEEA